MTKTLSTFLLLALVATSQATVLYGPFTTNGSWTTVFNGGFETGDTSGWGGQIVAANNHPKNGSLPYANTYTGRVDSPGTYPGAGFAVVQGITVTQNTDYVISGFFYRTATTGNVSIDLNDIAGDPQVYTDETFVDEWQYIYTTWNSGAFTNLTLRLVFDNGIVQGQTTYVDEIAVTKLGDFRSPDSVPEPMTLVLGLPALLLARKLKEN